MGTEEDETGAEVTAASIFIWVEREKPNQLISLIDFIFSGCPLLLLYLPCFLLNYAKRLKEVQVSAATGEAQSLSKEK